MRAWPQFSTETLIPWLGRLATLLMLALLAWLCANIYWSLSAPNTPRPATGIDTDPQHTAQAIASRHLFGMSAPATAGAPAASAPSDIRLNGAIAAEAPGKPAYALLAIEGKPAQVVREGDEVAPGITLQRVLPRQVELSRGGHTETLSLPQRGKN